MNTTCRWGILGSAAIARKVWAAMARAKGGHCGAVASRDAEKSEAFVAECSADTPMTDDQGNVVSVDGVGGYQALLDRDDIDAVYIPLPTGLRKPWILAAAKAGKHVLSEKPAAVHGDDLSEMMEACQNAGVQFMDGVMFDHSIRLQSITQAIKDGDLGNLRRVQTHFSFDGDDEFASSNIRGVSDLEPHGALGDLGWYCIRFTLWINGFELPKSVRGEMLWTIGDDVPAEFSGEMKFESGMTAGFFCSFRSANQQTAMVSGSNGYLSLDDFILPFTSGQALFQRHQHECNIERCRWHYNRRSETHATDEFSSGETSSQEVRMIARMNEIVNSGTLDPSLAERPLATQRVSDAMRLSAASGGAWIDLP